MVGGVSGLGFTFEKIIFANLVIRRTVTKGEVNSNFDIKNLNKIETRTLQDLRELAYLKIRDDTLYHFPYIQGIDGMFQIDNQRVLIQVPTSRRGIKRKFQHFDKLVKEMGVSG